MRGEESRQGQRATALLSRRGTIGCESDKAEEREKEGGMMQKRPFLCVCYFYAQRLTMFRNAECSSAALMLKCGLNYSR